MWLNYHGILLFYSHPLASAGFVHHGLTSFVHSIVHQFHMIFIHNLDECPMHRSGCSPLLIDDRRPGDLQNVPTAHYASDLCASYGVIHPKYDEIDELIDFDCLAAGAPDAA